MPWVKAVAAMIASLSDLGSGTCNFAQRCATYSANATLMVIEVHHMLRKGQHKNATNMSVFEQFYALAA